MREKFIEDYLWQEHVYWELANYFYFEKFTQQVLANFVGTTYSRVKLR